MTEALDDVMDELREHVRSELRMGFTPVEEIAESALDVFETDAPEQLLPMAEHLVRAESAALAREQAGWPAVTDCDRLDLAFDELERRGIVARHHFSCCMNCGSQEIWAEVEDAMEDGTQVRGHTFYHVQDTAGAAEGGGLHLAYGAMEEAGMEDVAREIISVLQAQGLATEWDGSTDTRIRVELDWKRRRDDL